MACCCPPVAALMHTEATSPSTACHFDCGLCIAPCAASAELLPVNSHEFACCHADFQAKVVFALDQLFNSSVVKDQPGLVTLEGNLTLPLPINYASNGSRALMLILASHHEAPCRTAVELLGQGLTWPADNYMHICTSAKIVRREGSQATYPHLQGRAEHDRTMSQSLGCPTS